MPRKKIYGVEESNVHTRLLQIKVLKITNLQKRRFLGGAVHPYVRIQLHTLHDDISPIDTARTHKVSKKLNTTSNEGFIFRVEPGKHRLVFEVYDQNKLTKDEFLDKFSIELNNNIPYESNEQPILTKDYPLTRLSVIQQARATVTIGLAFLNPTATLVESESTEIVDDEEDYFDVTDIHDHEVRQTLAEQHQSLPTGWEERRDIHGRTYYVDHNTRTTTWSRPNIDGTSNSRNSQSAVADRHQLDHVDSDHSSQNSGASVNSMSFATNGTTVMDELGSLPPGWEFSKIQNGRIFFIDHANRRTTWIDPRTNMPSSFPGVEDELSSNGPLPAQWEIRVLPDGRFYYIDHVNKSTTWTDPRIAGPDVPYSRDYETKYRVFRQNLPRPKPHIGKQIELHINRKNLIESSFWAVMSIKDTEVFKARLWIVFDQERGLDYSGVAREWFLLLSREIFNPYYGLFEYSASDNYTLQINPLSGIFHETHLRYFRFVGRIIGMAIYHGKILEAFFIRPIYKTLISKPITFADIESVDREYYQSLKYILENDPTDLNLYFVVNEEVLGELREHELIPNGQSIQVTEDNKHEYIKLLVNYRFTERIEAQMNALKQGLQDILPLTCIRIFDEKEIELLISGLGEINANDWRINTVYKGGYRPECQVIQWFWKAIGSFNIEERTRFLQFVTGTSRIPMNGFRELWGSSGPQLFTIEKWGDPTKLPRAHTCFNRLDLPSYASYDELRLKLKQAMEMCEGFDGVD